MKKIVQIVGALSMIAIAFSAQAGNPDRQGEAGAYELLLNPWARSAGFGNLVTANVSGLDAMQINPAGLGHFNTKMQVQVAHTRYLVGTGISLNTLGFAQKMTEFDAVAVTVMNVDFGNIPVTTTDQPDGTGVTFKPMFMNIGVAYNHTFNKKISVALGVRAVGESISNANAFAIGFNAGVQYVAGEDDNIHFGLSLLNVGTRMKYGGDGLSYFAKAPRNTQSLTVFRGPAGYNLPTQLNIGGAYDFLLSAKTQRLTLALNYTSNAFSRDRFGLGAEYAFHEQFMVRAAYTYEANQQTESGSTLETGFSAGATIFVPMKKGSDRHFGIDYAYRGSNPYSGSHTFGLRMDL